MQLSGKGSNPFYALFVKYREIGLTLILVLLVLGVGLRNSAFLAPSKLLFIVEDTAPLAILAAGMLCVLLIGSIDISIAGIMAFSAMAAGMVMKDSLITEKVTQIVDGVETVVTVRSGMPLIFIILIGMGVGAACGAVNGLLIAYGGVLPIVTTLGMQYIIYGMSHVISNGQALYKKDMTNAFIAFTRSEFLGINSKIWLMIGVYIVMFLFITYFRAGRHMYAVGSNLEAAEMRGIHTKRTMLTAHIIMGAIAGLAGLMFASHDTKITQDLKNGYELYVIASCVIGGVSVTGGSGKITGVLLGALTIGVINNGLTMMKLTGSAEFWKKAIQGGLILIAIVFNVILKRMSDRQNLLRRNI